METSVCHWYKFTGGSANQQNSQTDLKDKQRPGTPRVASTDALLAKITDIITNDGRFIIKQIANLVCIPSGTFFVIWIHHL